MGVGTITREWPPSSAEKGVGPNSLSLQEAWYSKSGARGPYVFVFEFAAPAEVTSLGFLPYNYDDDQEAPYAAQSVRVEASTQGPDSGYSTVGDYTLQASPKEQDYPLPRSASARWLRLTLQPRGGADHTSLARVIALGDLHLPPNAKPLTGVWLFDNTPGLRNDRLFLGGGRLADAPPLNESDWILQAVQVGSEFRALLCQSTGTSFYTMGGSRAGDRFSWGDSFTGSQLRDGTMNAEGNIVVGPEDSPYILMRLPPGHDCAHRAVPFGSGKNVLVLTKDGTFDRFAGHGYADFLAQFRGYHFTALGLSLFTAETLAGVDTVILGHLCGLGKEIAHFQSQALLDFVTSGHKLIIDDADACTTTDYSFLPYPFHTSNPGAEGAKGDNLVLVEPSTLGTDLRDSKQYVDLQGWVSDQTNQIGDANTVTTKDPHWCGHLFGTNALNVNGFMHMYAPLGQGLLIYNGFDADDLRHPTYAKLFLLELQQTVPALLPCTESVASKFLIAPSKTVPFAPGRTLQVQVPLQVLANQGYAGTVSLASKTPADAPWKTALSVGQVTLKGDTATVNFAIEVPANASAGGHEFLVTGNDAQGNTASATITLYPSATAEVAKVETVEKGCTRQLTIGSDALFAFNQATLTPTAQKTLASLGPEINKAGKHPVQVLGYTDAIGSDRYNQLLSEQRARSVRDWLVAHHYLEAGTPIQGMGKQNPVAANTNPDGSDNPSGRAKNRRVEVAIDTCK
jgi:outer membrane protein OmpA-like peptidoglycan-associated protein